MIPAAKNESVLAALRQAFHTNTIDALQPLTAGLSADLNFRIVVRGSPYLLRIMTRINEQNDPIRIFTATQAAAAAGIAPRVWYAGTEDGILLTDFIRAIPFPRDEAAQLLPVTLRQLHALPPFPKTFNFVTMHKFFTWRFPAANLVPKDQIDEAFAHYARIAAIYPRLDADMVSSHLDLKPENILFDGHKVWLIDWQAAFLNDRYYDLGIAANFLANNDEEARAWLQLYFGHPPDDYQLARFFLMRQVLHMAYATVFLLLASASQPADPSATLPDFEEFHQQMWAGEISLAGHEMRRVYGLIHWRQLLHNLRLPRFEQALQLVADRHSGDISIARLLPPRPDPQ